MGILVEFYVLTVCLNDMEIWGFTAHLVNNAYDTAADDGK